PALFLDHLHQHDLAPLDHLLNLVLPTVARQPLLYFFERVATDGVDDFVLDYFGGAAIGLAGGVLGACLGVLRARLGGFLGLGVLGAGLHGLGVLAVVVMSVMIVMVMIILVMIILVMIFLATLALLMLVVLAGRRGRRRMLGGSRLAVSFLGRLVLS